MRTSKDPPWTIAQLAHGLVHGFPFPMNRVPVGLMLAELLPALCIRNANEINELVRRITTHNFD